MTKAQAERFLTEAGHITKTERISETVHAVHFVYRGTSLRLTTFENDEEFFALNCSYGLREPIVDELAAYRAAAELQWTLKVAKIDMSIEDSFVTATVEQFLPLGGSFERLFWRSVDVVCDAARRAISQIDTTIAADAAAERFTEEIENDLQRRRKHDGA